MEIIVFKMEKNLFYYKMAYYAELKKHMDLSKNNHLW
jgi:hypothetical protein